MKLNRTQKRLLWVFRHYGERAPFVALYTWAILSLKYEADTMFLSVPPLGSIFQAAGGHSPGVPFGPGPDATLGEMTRWAPGYAQVRTEQGRWADSRCAKLIPALARWVDRAIKQCGWAERPSNYWGTPWRRLAHLSMSPSPLFLEWASEVVNDWQYVCDWYVATRPDLGDYYSWEEAHAAANAWHQKMRVETLSRVEKGPVVMRWPDGWTVQALTNRSMFVEEGRSLGHCIGQSPDYWEAASNGEAAYFSLRRPDGVPWLSIEVEAPAGATYRKSEPSVAQIKGCKNRMPGQHAASRDCPRRDPTECTRVWQFLSQTKWLVGPDYGACWGYTAASLGLPRVVQERSPAHYMAGELVMPPSPIRIPEPETTERFHPEWWKA